MSKLIPLSTVANVDISGVDKKKTSGERAVKLCNFTDVYNNWSISSDTQRSFMEASASDDEIQKFAIKKGQVAITKDSETKDDIGTAAYIAESFDDTVLGYHCALITPQEGCLEGEYLNVVLHSKYAQRYFEHNASGSGQRYTLTNDVIEGFPIPLIPLKEQKQIGKIFRDIDAQKNINESICADIEKIAKLIFDYWFIQYDFPDSTGSPYKSSGGKLEYNEKLKRPIPVGWDVCKIEDVLAPVPSSIKIKTDDYLISGKYPVVDQSTDYIVGYTNNEESVINIDGGCTVFGDHTCCTKYVKFPFARGADGTQVIFSNMECFPSSLLYEYIKMTPLPDVGYSRHYMYLKESYIPCPPKDLSKKYSEIVDAMWSLKMNLVEENYEIERTADFLLPLLMNGPIKTANKEF